MKNFIITLALTVILMLSMVATPVFAQNMQDPNYANQGSSIDQNSGTAGTTDDRGGFNWWWLLPLVALPLLYFAFRSNDDTDERTYTENGRSYQVGAKGGKRERDTEDEVI